MKEFGWEPRAGSGRSSTTRPGEHAVDLSVLELGSRCWWH